MGGRLPPEKIKNMAYVFSVTGDYQLAGKSGDRHPDTARKILRNAKYRYPEIMHLVQTGSEVACERGIAKAMEDRRRSAYVVRNDLALKRHREIHEMRAAQPSPVTLGQKLLGEPLAGRSAADQIETDKNGNVSERQPRVSFGAISIPDIRINNGHRA